MKQSKLFSLALILMLTITTIASAQRNKGDRNKPRTTVKNQHNKQHNNHYRTDQRHRIQPINRRNFHRAPNYRRIVRNIHKNHRRMILNGLTYYYYAGIYYQTYQGGYVIVSTPIGRRIVTLPFGYRTIYVNAVPYYYHSGTYYFNELAYQNDGTKYVVVNPPIGAIINSMPADVEQVEMDGENYYYYNNAYYQEYENVYGETRYEVIQNEEN
ncbi:MAG: hypothetical protein JKX98_03530 [Alcanivoracaceae bacterium]|nr:hypothetical protein [Alcanivoracaceae bacterium]